MYGRGKDKTLYFVTKSRSHTNVIHTRIYTDNTLRHKIQDRVLYVIHKLLTELDVIYT